MWFFCFDGGGWKFWETHFSKTQSRKNGATFGLVGVGGQIPSSEVTETLTLRALNKSLAVPFHMSLHNPLSSKRVTYIPQIADDAILLKCLI